MDHDELLEEAHFYGIDPYQNVITDDLIRSSLSKIKSNEYLDEKDSELFSSFRLLIFKKFKEKIEKGVMPYIFGFNEEDLKNKRKKIIEEIQKFDENFEILQVEGCNVNTKLIWKLRKGFIGILKRDFNLTIVMEKKYFVTFDVDIGDVYSYKSFFPGIDLNKGVTYPRFYYLEISWVDEYYGHNAL